MRKSGRRSQLCRLDSLSVCSLSCPARTGRLSPQRCRVPGEKYKPQRTCEVRPAGVGRTTRVPETPRAAFPSFCPFCTVGTRCRGVIFEHEDDIAKCLKGLRCLFLALLHTIWTLYRAEKVFESPIKSYRMGVPTIITNKCSYLGR